LATTFRPKGAREIDGMFAGDRLAAVKERKTKKHAGLVPATIELTGYERLQIQAAADLMGMNTFDFMRWAGAKLAKQRRRQRLA
jgi:hypothetical protein